MLPIEQADHIERLLFSNNFPWFFHDDITWEQKDLVGNDLTPGFSHVFFNGQPNSNGLSDVIMIPHVALNRLEKTVNFELSLIRAFLQLPLTNRRDHNNIHIDQPGPHTVCLYYVCDSDGDTLLFGKNKDDPVSQRVSPKKNRAVLFDGMTYHASSLPITNKRATINFNLI